ncbi:MAG: 30S ribosomal protein S8e [Candidatus Aenigmarchaeota archaeon]|nr:30S ribosomal protein S8e [Candidatus Aenigmarchaeota archaeon]
MTKWNLRANLKATGGRLNSLRKKRRSDRRREPTLTKLGEPLKRLKRFTGGKMNYVTMSANAANVTDPSTGKTRKVKILTVVDNPANPHFIRRNIINKGATIDTEAGKARVTSRPTRDGVVNAILVEPKK